MTAATWCLQTSGVKVTPARIKRLARKFTVGDNCWEWTAGKSWAGYGSVRFGGPMVAAHRLVYELLVGPIPPGLTLDHLCRNTSCVNPSHMEPVTDAENGLRGTSKPAINARKTHCLRGHPFDLIRLNGHRDCSQCHLQRQPKTVARGFEKLQQGGLPHGTAYSYRLGCKCSECRRAVADAVRLRTQRHKDGTFVDLRRAQIDSRADFDDQVETAINGLRRRPRLDLVEQVEAIFAAKPTTSTGQGLDRPGQC